MGDLVLVTNGVYSPISISNMLITIQSVSGAVATVIDGGLTSRCAELGSSWSDTNTALVGLTLRNGSADVGGGACYGTLNNCALLGNSAGTDGGGAYDGTLNNCTLSGNFASHGGGALLGAVWKTAHLAAIPPKTVAERARAIS